MRTDELDVEGQRSANGTSKKDDSAPAECSSLATLPFFAGVVVLAAGCSMNAPTDSGGVSSATSALTGAGTFDDTDGATPPGSPAANAVVSLNGCSGILLTPQMVLTAVHCIWGGHGGDTCTSSPMGRDATIGPSTVQPGPTFAQMRVNGQIVRGVSYDADWDACLPTDRHGQDFALVFLEKPVIGSSIQEEVAAGRGHDVAVPKLAPLPKSGSPSPTQAQGFTWGVAGFGAAYVFRHANLFANGWIDTHTDDYGGHVFDLQVNSWHTEHGDSGGPLFVVDPSDPDGLRRPIGTLNGRRTDITGTSMRWADITRSPGADWLQMHAKQGNVDPRIRRTPIWLQRHGQDESDWWGSLDYTGPCRLDVDRDCDGWFDRNLPSSQLHDNCFTIANPLQEDTGDIGVGDACDPDRDGWTMTPEKFSRNWNAETGTTEPFVADNCPTAFNPGQENCNWEFEKASIERSVPVEILGDACDPVPCAAMYSVSRDVGGHDTSVFDCDPQPHRTVNDQIVVTPVPPHKKTYSPVVANSVPPGINLPASVPTHFRYCNIVRQASLEVPCNNKEVLQDSQLLIGRDDTATELDPDYPWQRITLKQGIEGPELYGRMNNAGVPMTYANGSSTTIYWDYRKDDQHWHRDGIDLVKSSHPGEPCSWGGIYGDGTCLSGYFWAHADTPFGSSASTANTTINGTYLGYNGLNLANHIMRIIPDIALSVPACQPVWPCTLDGTGCLPSLDDLWLSREYCPNCFDDLLEALGAHNLHVPLINPHDGSVRFGIVDASFVAPADLGLSADVALALQESHFVGSNECQGAGYGVIDAVSLPASFGGATRYLVADPSEPGGFFVRDSAAGGAHEPASDVVLGRVGAKVVYSRLLNSAFVVGGLEGGDSFADTVIAVPNDDYPHEIGGQVAGAVLAAAIRGDVLWTVEHPTDASGAPLGDEVRLAVRGIQQDQVSEPMWVALSGSETRPSARYALSAGCASGDNVVLTVSDPEHGTWAAFETDLARLAVGWHSASEGDTLQPLADASMFEGSLVAGAHLGVHELAVPRVDPSTHAVFIHRVPRSGFLAHSPIIAHELWNFVP